MIGWMLNKTLFIAQLTEILTVSFHAQKQCQFAFLTIQEFKIFVIEPIRGKYSLNWIIVVRICCQSSRCLYMTW